MAMTDTTLKTVQLCFTASLSSKQKSLVMKKGIVVNFSIHRDQQAAISTLPDINVSAELGTAIEALIYRLRELGPIQ